MKSAFEGENWRLSTQSETELMEKMGLISVPLGEFVPIKINYGIKTGLNTAFIIDSATRRDYFRRSAKRRNPKTDHNR
jgi:hypothetical protein